MKKIILLFSVLYSLTLYSQENPNYPETEKGMKRVDLKLPKIENYKDYKVEIRFGMEINISECSEITDFGFNMKNLEEKYAIPPYRFPYYVLPKEIPVDIISLNNNKSDCDKTKKVKKKVLSSQNIFREYNGHYAIPFYIPEKWNVEYRLWKVNSDFKNAEL
jgi:serine protease inhibitor ecotin